MSNQICRFVENRDQRDARLRAIRATMPAASQNVGQLGDRLIVITHLLYGSFKPDSGKTWPATFVTMDGRALLGHLPAGTVGMVGDYYTLDCLISEHLPANPLHDLPIERTKVYVIAAKHSPFYDRPFEGAY